MEGKDMGLDRISVLFFFICIILVNLLIFILFNLVFLSVNGDNNFVLWDWDNFSFGFGLVDI